MKSNEDKVRLWTLSSRFCIMVDRVPAGHIAEYVILKQQNSILALLRPRAMGSTRIIDYSNLVDLNFIQNFEFELSPLEVLDSAVTWEEGIARSREEAYNMEYPWWKDSQK